MEKVEILYTFGPIFKTNSNVFRKWKRKYKIKEIIYKTYMIELFLKTWYETFFK